MCFCSVLPKQGSHRISVKLSGKPTIFLWLLMTKVGVMSMPIHEAYLYKSVYMLACALWASIRL